MAEGEGGEEGRAGTPGLEPTGATPSSILDLAPSGDLCARIFHPTPSCPFCLCGSGMGWGSANGEHSGGLEEGAGHGWASTCRASSPAPLAMSLHHRPLLLSQRLSHSSFSFWFQKLLPPPSPSGLGLG